ncbi:hypothetical protein QCA50_006427 [Cerrena zonata]|uniref:Uncharacterized protein n=1 Tax=Cerrena zonata TaxID=2478898 RepID=A0AAW0G8N1_9APHY
MADPQTHAHTNAHHPILEDVDWDDVDAACDHPVPPLPPDLAFSLSHLSTLRLSLGSQGATTPMDDHHIAAFLACMPNLEKLTLRNMISRSSSKCILRRTVHLPRLRILNLLDGDQEITSLLHHLHITPKVKLDIEIVSLTNVHFLVDVFSKIRRILRGSNDNTQQTLKSLTMVATLQGLVVKGHFDLREFCSMRRS